MKVIIALVVVSVALVNTSNVSDKTEVTTKDEKHDTTPTSALEEIHRIRPIFPKSGRKFTVTIKPRKIKNATTVVNRPYNKPVFKIVSKAMQIKNKNYWKTATRPSLMKYRKFTVNPLIAFNIHRHSIKSNKKYEKDAEIERKQAINKFTKSLNLPNEDDSSEEAIETLTTNGKRRNKMKHAKTLINRFHTLRSKNSKGNNMNNFESNEKANKLNTNNIAITNDIKPSEAEFSSEEREDRKEYIFVTTKKIKEHTVIITKESDESDETTSSMLEKELQSRQKRSVNVIEEENLGTTVSGFKFTGKVASLSSDLVFRNIHT